MTTPSDIISDVDATIALWERTGVDWCDAWWALGYRWPNSAGWPQVRKAMIRIALAYDTPAQRAA